MDHRSFSRAVLIALCAGSWLGCGAPSSLALCHADCEAALRCQIQTEPQVQGCHRACDEQADMLAARDREEDERCKNASEVRAAAQACLERACAEILPCGVEIDRRCIPRG
jgi:hypothetical protein